MFRWLITSPEQRLVSIFMIANSHLSMIILSPIFILMLLVVNSRSIIHLKQKHVHGILSSVTYHLLFFLLITFGLVNCILSTFDRGLLHNVATRLKPGGFFVGTITDARVLVYVAFIFFVLHCSTYCVFVWDCVGLAINCGVPLVTHSVIQCSLLISVWYASTRVDLAHSMIDVSNLLLCW
jgi:hypothetical protein